jgi:predicted short-subunit dehydrogenase-like oxidoreductase (DUF2520 family)
LLSLPAYLHKNLHRSSHVATASSSSSTRLLQLADCLRQQQQPLQPNCQLNCWLVSSTAAAAAAAAAQRCQQLLPQQRPASCGVEGPSSSKGRAATIQRHLQAIAELAASVTLYYQLRQRSALTYSTGSCLYATSSSLLCVGSCLHAENVKVCQTHWDQDGTPLNL